MGKKSVQPNHNKSLKTFYLYAVVVVVLILVSLVIKGILLFQQSIFDPSHHFTLEVRQKNTVRELISFNPQIPGISVLVITDKNIPYTVLAKDYGITADGYVQLDDAIPLTSNSTSLLWSAITHSATLDTDLTIFDTVRLFLLSKNVATNNEVITDVGLKDQSNQTNTDITQALTDPELASESISVQIVNATTTTGLGQRLGKVLTNMGANVVDVSSAQEVQKETTIGYYGDQSVTLTHLQKLLHVTPTKLTTQPIANIVITIGTDKSKTTTF